jgi:hypothetical protein
MFLDVEQGFAANLDRVELGQQLCELWEPLLCTRIWHHPLWRTVCELLKATLHARNS